MADEEKKTEDAAKAPAEAAPEKAEEPKAEVAPAKEDSEGAKAPSEDVADKAKDIEMTADQKKLIDQIEKMSVLELHQLVKVMEEKFGVSAQAVAVAAPGATSDSGDDEQDSFTIELKDAGSQKIAIIKAMKELLGLGLKEAKDLVDSAPTVIKEGIKKDEVEAIKAKVEEAGGTVEVK